MGGFSIKSHPRPVLGGAAAMVAATLALVAAIRQPSVTTASPVIRAGTSIQTFDRPRGRVLGEFVGVRYRVRAVTSPDGPRYDVLTLDGAVIKDGLLADEVYKHFPGLEITELQFGPDAGAWDGGALMFADTPSNLP